jgi:Ca-activated chloride channel family protein
MNLFKKQLACLLILPLILLAATVSAQNTVKKTRILFVLDASGSMYARMDSENRIDIAKRLLGRIVDSLKTSRNVELALRVYGHRSPTNEKDCRDTRLEVGFAPDNHAEIINKINGIVPKGTTLIAQSLLEAGGDFPSPLFSKNILILITDGMEECNGDPCAVSEALQKKGVILKPFIIGLGGNPDFARAFECVGKYYDAGNEASFNKILNVVISQAINATTAQVNLNDIFGNPTESNVNMSFYDSHSGSLLYNYVHAINARAVPDTVQLDPAYNYNMVVHTIPPVEKKNISLTPGKHTVIPIDAGQGMLQLKIGGITAYQNLQCIIKQAGKKKIIHVQLFNTSVQYLVGKYDLEILTLPRIIMKDVEVTQSYTNTIEVSQPGKVTLYSTSDLYADIYQYNKNVLQWVINLEENIRVQTLVMQPGTYKIIYRPKNFNKSSYTCEKEFTITSGGTVQVRF